MTNNLSKLITIILMAGALLLGGACKTNKASTPGDKPPEPPGARALRDAKTFGALLAVAGNRAIAFEANLAESGAIDPADEPGIRQWLLDGKHGLDLANTRLATYTTFDSSSRADIQKLLNDAQTFVEQASRDGLLRIKNPKSRLIAQTIIDGVAAAIETYNALHPPDAAPPTGPTSQ